jgi:dienelactone hydrolase
MAPAGSGLRDASFASPTGRRIGAWFAPGAPGGGAVLLLHPVRGDRRAMLGRARFLQAAGVAVLLADLQAHGESDGARIAFGAREAEDVAAMLDALARLAPGETLGAIGWSLGGAALVLSGETRRLAGVVLEAVYPTLGEALDNRLRLHLGPLGPLAAPLLTLQLGPRLGIPPGALAPIERIAALCAPVLVINGAADRHTTPAEAGRLAAAARESGSLLILEGAAHVDLHRHATIRYETEVAAFLVPRLRAPSAPACPPPPG